MRLILENKNNTEQFQEDPHTTVIGPQYLPQKFELLLEYIVKKGSYFAQMLFFFLTFY